MNEILIPNARFYADRHQLELVETLGSGKDGIVLVAKHKAQPASGAIKMLRWNEAYLREKQVYERLKSLGVTAVIGFNVPQLLGFQDDLRAIEMTIVKRPFVLDFAGAHLDTRPQFPEEVWADWEAEKREQFEARWPDVRRVLDAFEELGIYLLDVSPGNISFMP
jgi:hypothetical protein